MKIKASKFKSELCNHYDYEDCMNCSECGLCLETLNDEDVCPNCAQGNTIAYCLSGRNKGEVIDVTETESMAWDDGFKNGVKRTNQENIAIPKKDLIKFGYDLKPGGNHLNLYSDDFNFKAWKEVCECLDVDYDACRVVIAYVGVHSDKEME